MGSFNRCDSLAGFASEVFYASTTSNKQIRIGHLAGQGIEIMGSAGPIGGTLGWDTDKIYKIYSISGFAKGIDIGYGTWETNTGIYHLKNLFGN